MTEILSLEKMLSKSFCQAISVRAVPSGFAISTPFADSSGDRLSFYAKEVDGSYILEDDGSFLSHLVASGIDIDKGQRQQLLDSVLRSSGAYWDRETFEIRSDPTKPDRVGEQSVMFLSALMRVRDIELLTKEVIRSTFKEDATKAILERFGGSHRVEERAAIAPEYSEYPADIILRPADNGKQAAVFLVNSSTQFMEAELLHAEIEKQKQQLTYSAVALIEDTDKLNIIGLRRIQRAINRGLPIPIFRGDEIAAMTALSRTTNAA
ncbi:DUF1828 domain-containing protein [Mesorhizobium sp.]|uniref:DUF1828 domain-containing protein n=1 Tax=Mesorhizobium sp. TaxID=1871066 RepID=UPI000FEA0A52|nr:DUF1828 domain-containing protein [Mesorhizobium sp.]RWE97363.1 MAG: DUF1828 domain-containing protein [Mesorhizobium sp.]